eukprot:TRINITY_DN2282_c0_g1_i3.p1 TRINITY_DN2282_c0_g1~~TRINITY_DN2282_c0_g1_i3.p1  ORF type:complete len:274 (+),score=52.44 TRINITY_DN2282_c0_g1_i3:154-975(+)
MRCCIGRQMSATASSWVPTTTTSSSSSGLKSKTLFGYSRKISLNAINLRISERPWRSNLQKHSLAETTGKSALRVSSETSQFSADIGEAKTALNNLLQGLSRGIFGVPSAKKQEIECLINLLEESNPLPNPTDNLHLVDGQWRLLYSTVTILGSKRTKLGLRGLVTLGDILQTINTKEGKAQNIVGFTVAGLATVSGEFIIDASFEIANSKRVNIKYEKSRITPEKLFNLLRMNYNLILSIFNPEGWLDINYMDESIRICRDDKGNIFLLERI